MKLPEKILTTCAAVVTVAAALGSLCLSLRKTETADLLIRDVAVNLGLDNETDIRLVFLSDLHLLLPDESVGEDYVSTVDERYESMFVNAEGVRAADLWPDLSFAVNELNAESVWLGGDMIDYSSETNAEILCDGLQNIEMPCFYLRADHDLAKWYSDTLTSGETREISETVSPYEDVFVEEFDDFLILGWNNSTSQMSEAGLQIAQEAFAFGKPVILMTHVPLNSTVTDALYEASCEHWDDRALIWGEGCYYEPNETTAEFLDLVLADSSPVRAVFSGHLHFEFEVPLNDNCTEYVCAPAFEGNVTRITLR